MNTGKTLAIPSISSSVTEHLGERVGAALKGGETIELVSDLGGGKTTFVRGLACGMGSKDHVASPTFTINRQYQSPKLTLQHFDFYRLEDSGLIKHELAEAAGNPNSVLVVEWPGNVSDVLPEDRLTVEIKTTSENERQVTFRAPDSLKYLLKDVDTSN